MSDYGKLMSRIWGDKDFIALDSRPQQVFMMLFSFPTRNLAGVLPLTIRRWANCSGDATIENVHVAIEKLITDRYIMVDWDTEEALIRTYIRNDEVWRQPNLMTRCLKYCDAVASEKLRVGIGFELTRIAQELMPTDRSGQQKIREDTLRAAKLLVRTFSEGLGEPSGNLCMDLGDTFAKPPGDTPSPSPSPSPAPAPDTKPPAGVSKGVAVIDDSAPPSKRGTRLQEGWKPPEDAIRAMRKEFPHIDLRHEHAKFCDYWQSKPGKDAVKIDWVKTWRNWIRTASERTPNHTRSLSGPDKKAVDWMAYGVEPDDGQKGLSN